MNLLIWGIRHDDVEDGPAEEIARVECTARWGNAERCLVVDISGRVMLNTTGVDLENLDEGYVDGT